MKIPHPADIFWRCDPLPPVDEVPPDRWVVIWADNGYIATAQPHGDDMSPVRWCDNKFPLLAMLRHRVTSEPGVLHVDDPWVSIPFWWAVLIPGTPGIKHEYPTWRETYGIQNSEHPQIPL